MESKENRYIPEEYAAGLRAYADTLAARSEVQMAIADRCGCEFCKPTIEQFNKAAAQIAAGHFDLLSDEDD